MTGLRRSMVKSAAQVQAVRRSYISLRPAHCFLPIFTRSTHTSSTSSTMDPRIDQLVSFYADRNPGDWFSPSESFDRQLHTQYAELVNKARSPELDAWADTAKGALALVILLDQIPRNIFRGSGESFSSDHKALSVAAQAIAKGFDRDLGREHKFRQFLFYLPFMHTENLVGQIAAKSLIENLYAQCPENSEEKQFMQGSIDFAQKHLDCVASLGRFPKRNEPLGRETTADEEQFLKEHPEGF